MRAKDADSYKQARGAVRYLTVGGCLVENTGVWVRNLMKAMDENIDGLAVVGVMEGCGRECARGWAAGQADECAGAASTEGARVDELSKRLPVLRRQGATAIFEYPICYCKQVEGVLDMPVSYCNCSVGWVREVMERLLLRPVEVALERSIIRGGDSCLFTVPLGD